MIKKLRMGVIGCGVMGKRHCADIKNSELMELAAAADIVREAAEEAGAAGGAEKIYTDADSLINDADVDAVVIAMPTFARTGLALKCFKAGKHVMLEKPVAMNAGEVEKMMDACGKLTVGCFSSRYRFTAPAEAASSFIAGGALGNIRIVRVRALRPDNGPPSKNPPPWRLKKSLNGGGILMNWGCYDLDYVLGITGWKLEPELVLAQTWPISPKLSSRAAPDSDAETHFSMLARCKGGSAVSFERGEFMPAEGESAWQVVGDNGTLNLQMLPAEEMKLIFHRGSSEGPVSAETVWEGGEGGPMSFRALEDFARAVSEKRSPSTGLGESLIIQKLTDAVYESAEKGEAVRL
jgi:predicted dehydrogenase